MKKQILFLSLIAIGFMVVFSSCTAINKTMKEPNVKVELNKADFELSGQVSAEASSTKVFNIDWKRLFSSQQGHVQGSSATIDLAVIPIVGTLVFDPTQNYALYELMKNNPGYDVVFFPQFEVEVKCPIGISFIYKKTTVKATARLGKLK